MRLMRKIEAENISTICFEYNYNFEGNSNAIDRKKFKYNIHVLKILFANQTSPKYAIKCKILA